MAIYSIVKIGDDILKSKSNDVIKFDFRIEKLIKNMEDTIKSEKGFGLAACQIGIPKRVILLNYKNKIDVFINPFIIFKNGETLDIEGCLSVPGIIGKVKRADKIKVKAKNKYGENFIVNLNGFYSRIVQHEIDHLDGILFIDKAESLERGI